MPLTIREAIIKGKLALKDWIKTFTPEIFEVNFSDVIAGRGKIYSDPDELFSNTYLTGRMRDVLKWCLARAAGHSGSTTYIIPLMRLVSVATERELGTTVHLVTLSVPSIQQGFSASGTFNMMRRTLGTDRAEYARDVKAGGTAELYVDGAQAASFQVQAGDKVKVVVLYSKIQLSKIG
jgi:hypothetical protein